MHLPAKHLSRFRCVHAVTIYQSLLSHTRAETGRASERERERLPVMIREENGLVDLIHQEHQQQQEQHQAAASVIIRIPLSSQSQGIIFHFLAIVTHTHVIDAKLLPFAPMMSVLNAAPPAPARAAAPLPTPPPPVYHHNGCSCTQVTDSGLQLLKRTHFIPFDSPCV